MSNQNNIDELIPLSEVERSKELNEQFKIMKGLVIDIVKESKGNRLGAFDGKSLNDAVKAQQASTQAINELGLTTRTYNNLKKITNELEQVGKDTIEEYQLLVRKMTIERNNLNLKTQEGAVRQKELNKQIDEFNNLIKNNKDALAQQKMNIGNYSGALSGLQFNMTQVLRELPSLATGMQNFAVAIGNNVPQVATDIQRIIALNKELQAEGKPTTSVFTTLAASVFSWQTALILGLTALPKAIDMIKNYANETSKADEENKKYAESIARIDAEATKSATNEIAHLKVLEATTLNTVNSQEQRIKAAEELQSLYPNLLSSYSKEAILNGEAATAIDLVTEALVKRARASAVESKISEASARDYELLQKQRIAIEDLAKANKALSQSQQTQPSVSLGGGFIADASHNERKAVEDATKNLTAIRNARIQLGVDMLQYERDYQEFAKGVGNTLGKPETAGKETVFTKAAKDAEVADDRVVMLQRSLKEVLDLANESLDRVPQFTEKNPIIENDKKVAEARLRIAKELHDAKVALERQGVEAIIALGDILLESETKHEDEKQKNVETTKDHQLAYIDSLNISDQNRRDLKYAAEKEAFAAEKQIDNERQAIEKRKFALNQAQALSEILFTTQKAVAAVQAEAAVLAATPATAALAASALAQIPTIYISAAISAGLIGAKILSYGDGTPVGGHPGGAAEVAERGKPEWYRPSPNSPWQLITDHTLFPNMPAGAEVVPMDKASDGMLTPKLRGRVASMGGINMLPLIKSMNDVKQAVERKPVPVFNIGRGAIQEAVIIGNDRIYRLRRNIND